MAIIKSVRTWTLTGDSDAIRSRCKGILAAAKSTKATPEKILLITASAGQLLAMIDKPAARTALAPFVKDNQGKLELVASKLMPLDPRSKARVLTQVANLMYRNLQVDSGLRLATQADKLLQDTRKKLAPLEFLLDWSENAIWRVRMEWRKARSKDVHNTLRTIVHTLEAGYTKDNASGFGAITLNLAIALELWAAVDWFKGHLSEARAKVFRSIALHGEVKDSVRAAYAYYTAGRIEYSHERSEFTWAEHLLGIAEDAFEKLRHPFLWRASIQRARCVLRRDTKEAEDLVNRMNHRAALDDLEKIYADGERELTRAWICEASDSSGAPKRALAHSQFLVANADRLPTRLAAEGYLHQALARTKLGERRNDILQDLSNARKLAVAAESIKIQIASDLAAAQLLADSQDDVDAAEASRFVKSAEHHLNGVESKFLRDWYTRVASKLDRYVPTLMAGKWSDVQDHQRRTYYVYHSHRSDSVSDLLERTGWSPNTYTKYRKEYGPGIRRPARTKNR